MISVKPAQIYLSKMVQNRIKSLEGSQMKQNTGTEKGRNKEWAGH